MKNEKQAIPGRRIWAIKIAIHKRFSSKTKEVEKGAYQPRKSQQHTGFALIFGASVYLPVRLEP